MPVQNTVSSEWSVLCW